MESEFLLRQIETNLRVAITVAVFFPSLLNAFYTFTGSPEKDGASVLTMSGLVVGYILSYIIFQLIRSGLKNTQIKTFNSLLLVGIASYIFPIILITTKQFAHFDSALFTFSLHACFFVSLVSFVLLLAFKVYNYAH